MYLKSFSVLTCFFLSVVLPAQSKNEVFEIAAPDRRVGSTLYNSIRLVDLRFDPDDYGLVQTGALNRTKKIVVEIPLEDQLKKLMRLLTFSTLQSGELVLVLRHLSFAEVHGLTEKGYCYLRATLYAGKEGQYRRLDGIDTAVVVKGLDVTKPMFRKGSRMIADFIADNLIRDAVDSQSYTLNQLNFIEKIEKSKLPAYNTLIYPNGLYKTYEDFANLRPVDAELKVEFSKKEKVRSVTKKNSKGVFEKLNSNEAYAFVFQGKPYIVTEYGYYQMQRKVGDFYFTGKAQNQGKEADVVTVAFFFGVVGVLVSMQKEGTLFFEMKLDYVTGSFIRLREASVK